MTRDEWNVLCGHVTDEMRIHTRPYVTPLIHGYPGEHTVIGTGTYIDIERNDVSSVHLLTCEHVIRHIPQDHAPYGSDQAYSLYGTVQSKVYPLDAAIVRLTKQAWSEQCAQAQALPLGTFARAHNAVENEALFFRGISGENINLNFGQADTILSCYCSQEKPGTHTGREIEFLWEPAETQVTSGTTEDVREQLKYQSAAGFSGSLVWNTRSVELGCDLSRWTPEDAVVTGLLRRWDRDSKTLLALKVEHLLEWLA